MRIDVFEKYSRGMFFSSDSWRRRFVLNLQSESLRFFFAFFTIFAILLQFVWRAEKKNGGFYSVSLRNTLKKIISAKI